MVFFSPAHPPAGGCQPTKKAHKHFMLSSQPRSSKIFFSLYCFLKGKKYFIVAVPKDSRRFPNLYAGIFFFMPSHCRSDNGKACGSVVAAQPFIFG
jgi:hypothetical protein